MRGEGLSYSTQVCRSPRSPVLVSGRTFHRSDAQRAGPGAVVRTQPRCRTNEQRDADLHADVEGRALLPAPPPRPVQRTPPRTCSVSTLHLWVWHKNCFRPERRGPPERWSPPGRLRRGSELTLRRFPAAAVAARSRVPPPQSGAPDHPKALPTPSFPPAPTRAPRRAFKLAGSAHPRFPLVPVRTADWLFPK